MTVEYHPAVQRDFNDAVAYYEAAGGGHLADQFEFEFRTCIEALKAGPTRFPPYSGNPLCRRIRLDRFPYLVLYREVATGIRVLLLKHERRHPLYGLSRW
jgi:plasmid stabilization system protein ParE